MVFPEGGISVSGDRQPEKPGLSWLAAKTGASMVGGKLLAPRKAVCSRDLDRNGGLRFR
jgi:hypothetical protein